MNFSSPEKKACDQISRMREEIVQTIQELVRIPSVVGQEGKAQAYVERPGKRGGDHRPRRRARLPFRPLFQHGRGLHRPPGGRNPRDR